MSKTNGNFKKVFICLMAVVFAIGAAAVPAIAKKSIVNASSKPAIKEVEYKGKGKVEVDFYGKVQYKNPKVVVKGNGKTYKAKIVDLDDDDLDFKTSARKTGKKYKFTIKGIKKRGVGSYTSVSGYYRVDKKNKIRIDSIEYDKRDQEVSFEFKDRVKWKNPKVLITDGKGRSYVKRICEKGNNEIEVKVKNMKYGARYSYKISGVKKIGGTEYRTIKGIFRAVDD